MPLTTLDRARIGQPTIDQIMHRLAAANHHQWIAWQSHFLPNLGQLRELDAMAAADQLLTDGGFRAMVESHAKEAASIVSLTVTTFATPQVNKGVFLTRKREQLLSWITYALEQTSRDALERWLLQCRTPFLYLPRTMQKSDYVEAVADLAVVVEWGGLILSGDPSLTEPLDERSLQWRRLRHSLGMHGGVGWVGSERPWSNVCFGCGRTWAGDHG